MIDWAQYGRLVDGPDVCPLVTWRPQVDVMEDTTSVTGSGLLAEVENFSAQTANITQTGNLTDEISRDCLVDTSLDVCIPIDTSFDVCFPTNTSLDICISTNT